MVASDRAFCLVCSITHSEFILFIFDRIFRTSLWSIISWRGMLLYCFLELLMILLAVLTSSGMVSCVKYSWLPSAVIIDGMLSDLNILLFFVARVCGGSKVSLSDIAVLFLARCGVEKLEDL